MSNIYAVIPNTILIPLLICACVVVFFGFMDTIAWIRFKGKKHKQEKATNKSEQIKSEETASEEEAKATRADNAESAAAFESAESLKEASKVAEEPKAEETEQKEYAKTSEDSEGSSVTSEPDNTETAEEINNSSEPVSEQTKAEEEKEAAEPAEVSAVSPISSVSISTVKSEDNTSEAAFDSAEIVSSSADKTVSEAVSAQSSEEDQKVIAVETASREDSEAQVIVSDESSDSSLHYSLEGVEEGEAFGADGSKGHGCFLIFAFAGGDANDDYYDYYVSPYGDRRRCLYHTYPDGSKKIVFDEALVNGEFFPSDYFIYYGEPDGRRTRVHVIAGVFSEKEEADFSDPFADSYDIAYYADNGERKLAHYQGNNKIDEQTIKEPDIALNRDFTYKDGSGNYYLRHNRLAEETEKETDIEEEKGKKSYKKRVPFLIKLANSSDKLQSQYAEIKELMLSYKTHERASIPCDTYSKHRINYLKAEINGKHLNLAYRLDPKAYDDSAIPVKDVSDKKIYSDTPLMIKVSSGLSLRRAKKLIIDMMGEDKSPDEEKEPSPVKKTKKVRTVKPSKEETEETSKKRKPRVPFKTKLEKADKILKERYKEIYSEMEAYGIHSRISIPCDTYSLHRQEYLKITIDGRSLKAFFHLNPKDYDGTTIPHEDASNKKVYADTPLLLRLTSDLAVKRAKKLIADMMDKASVSKKN
jgi:hypothetical protein